MNLYPSLEDMKVDKLQQAQLSSQFMQNPVPVPNAPMTTTSSSSLPYSLNPTALPQTSVLTMYPGLGEYMGFEFTQDIIAANMPEYLHDHQTQSGLANYQGNSGNSTMVAPISGADIGLQRSKVTHGIREILLCKGIDHKVGLRVKNVNKGIFVCLVKNGSPAALSGLRFGDQILQINGVNVAGYSIDKVNDIFKKCSENGISLSVRDRPFERTITMHKDSSGHIGFQFTEGEITALVKDSSAARNGVLINHQLLEVNGQNVVGLKDREISAIVMDIGNIVTITVMPSFVFKMIVKNMSSSLVSKLMDHSMPDL